MHFLLIIVGCCYGSGLNEVERPVFTWVQSLGSHLEYLGAVS